jgi:drug/metabolite transporter (DMT)-like permease
MSRAPGRRTLGIAALVYAAAMWGATFFVVKGALAQVDAVTLVAYRFLIAGGLLALGLALKRRPLLAGWRHGLFLGVVLWVLYLAQTIGLSCTSATNSGFITGLFIVFTPLVVWGWLKRAPTGMQALAVACALAGLWLLTGGVAGANAGDVLTLAAAVTYAIHVVYAGRLMERGIDPWVLNCQQILVVGVLALLTCPVQAWLHAWAQGAPYSGALAAQFTVSGAAGWGAIVFLALFPTITAYAAQLYGQQVVDATRAALIFTLEPVFAAVFAWTLGGEAFHWQRAAGGAVIVCAMVLSEVRWPSRKPADADQE